ncbi:hypothetical protein E2C01_053040 [Portunus trituberculatus]|uniref:Uncharacterized protein n=1 Tax=Portunus trituberculatus TaxID=210409 RepID=A0A5B7GNF6_PORTR|nr:hypothetical protein [Portunus trituberculatus]
MEATPAAQCCRGGHIQVSRPVFHAIAGGKAAAMGASQLHTTSQDKAGATYYPISSCATTDYMKGWAERVGDKIQVFLWLLSS